MTVEIVMGVGASHTTLMNTRWGEVTHLPRAHAFRNGLAEARDALGRSGAEVAVIIGPNHFRGLWLDLMPTFAVGVDVVRGAGEHGTPAGELPTDPALAGALLDGLIAAGFDPAFSVDLQVDHGITHAVQYVVPDGMPVVPLLVNCFAPPLPTLARCAALGRAVSAVLAAAPVDRRVAVLASGGLSHQLPFPDWRHPGSDDDEFLVDSWRHGRSRWADYEQRRRTIITSAASDVREDFDLDFLARLSAGTPLEQFAAQDSVGARGGNGAEEVRSWVAMAAACGSAPARTVVYSPMPEWLTGMAVAIIDHPTRPEAPA